MDHPKTASDLFSLIATRSTPGQRTLSLTQSFHLVELEEADPFQEERLSGLGRETQPPLHCNFLAAGLDVQRIERLWQLLQLK